MSKPKKAPAKKKTNGYKMPDPIAAGEILQDIYKKQWVIGPSIGKGGFGEIYSAKQADSQSKEYKYVIKIEPHENGPLFVEMHFYTRCAREKDVTAFKEEKKLKHLGMPIYIASGSHVYKDDKYRFILMERFAPKDVWKLFIENNRKLPAVTVYRLAIQMLDALEYIHSKGYIHGDLKGANILLSAKNQNLAYLVDFGLAGKYVTDPEFIPNPKRMHNGTIEYLSRDAHYGVQTRRGDLEILAYNMIHWLTGQLPWDNNSNPKSVQEEKEKYMKNVKLFTKCFDNYDGDMPGPIIDFLNYINSIKHNQEPDYVKIKKMLVNGLETAGGNESSALLFASSQKRKSTSNDSSTTPKKRAKATANNKKGKETVAAVDNGLNEDAPTSSVMNSEEMRIAALKSKSKAVGKKPAQKVTKKKGTIKSESSDEATPDENQVPSSSSMNTEEKRILSLKNKSEVKSKTKRAGKKELPLKDESSSDDSADENEQPTSKKGRAIIRTKKPMKSRTGDGSPPRNGKGDLLRVLEEGIRRSPRNRGKEPIYRE